MPGAFDPRDYLEPSAPQPGGAFSHVPTTGSLRNPETFWETQQRAARMFGQQALGLVDPGVGLASDIGKDIGGGDFGEAALKAPLLGMALIPGLRAKPGGALPRPSVLQAQESIPSRASGHLSGIQDQPYGVKQAYTKNSPVGEGIPGLGQTDHLGTGSYSTDLGVETNPVRINSYDDMSLGDAEAVGAFGSAMGVQDAAPLTLPAGRGGYEPLALDVQVPGGLSGADVQALGSNPPGGAFGVIDLPSGPRFLGDEIDTNAVLTTMREQGLSPTDASASRVTSVYPDFKAAWGQGEGSGAVTRQFLDAAGGASPRTQQALESYGRSGALEKQNLADQQIAEQLGLRERTDVYRLRDIFSREGFDGLRQALARGEALPSIASTVAISQLLMGENQGGTEAERGTP